MPKEEWQKAWIITLSESNTGKRAVFFEGNIPVEIRDKIEIMWMCEGLPPSAIEAVLWQCRLLEKNPELEKVL